ncbi:unnamed protein product (macronuclear) [Paramecium tetraurelia]|uniref:Phospholipid/glycerol acyltransferase domain-containing protein n=1 Tax=Paramecium tetraurelia TaxID=5888 RepID=A0C4Z1_PARTE|nr:uncharacterized protein GSPATT00006357001 [Paramecium tetraurelia]CAK65858.1 unnamed protein product [Paramecium tetraurelia]|eukprot:XP_001433255.1 hypothetical protein (macronuclear) [Paramecium tetraurelia strain d4-2]
MLQQYYDKKVLFLTGCTGFVGKVLLEKTLRCLPNIACIYVLIRQKKGSNLMERFKREILDSQCFDRLRKTYGSGFEKFVSEKIYPIEGDMLKDGLGLAQHDRQIIINNVNIIINCAASVDFNARLDDAIQINVRGPQRFIALAQQIKNLENFIHISTAYVNSDKGGYIEEKIYDPGQENLEQLVTQLLKTPVSILEKNVKDIIGDFPNTYTFTKCIAEKLLVQTRSPNFPLTLVRPSIVGASWKDPVPGWIDSLVASSAIFFFVGLGLIKTLNGDECLIGDQVPVDYVSDFILTAGAYQNGRKEVSVYHCCSSAKNPMTWALAKEVNAQFWTKSPSSQQFSKPNLTFYKNERLYKLMTKIKNTPALMYYQIANRIGNKEMKIQAKRLKKIIERAESINETFKPFVINEWIFESSKSNLLVEFLSESEKQNFNVDIEKLNWRNYLERFNWGIQKYILKDQARELSEQSTDVLSQRNQQSYFSDIEWCLNNGQDFKTKTAKEQISLVMNSQRVQSVIKQLVEEKAKKYQSATLNLEKFHQNIEKQGVDICEVMFANYNMGVIRIFAWFITKVFRQIYEKVQINEQAMLELQNYNQKEGGPLIFMPTHRSYIDFIMCSYVFFSYKIKCPHIAAAEDFLQMSIIPIILRASGAFFLKRKQLEDSILYKAIFYEYVQRILIEECYLEFFIEGTRSRTGKTLNPKFGLLSIVSDAVFDKKIPNATILPITINYEKVLEADTYPYELLGEEKVKESLIRVIKALKILSSNFGKINVSFGKMISLKEWSKQQGLDSFENMRDRKKAVETLGYEVAYRLIEELVVMPTGIVSTLLLMNRRGITEDQLIKRFEWVLKQITMRGAKTSITNNGQSDVTVRNSIGFLQDLIYKKKKNVFELTLIPKQEYKSILLLSYYRNQLAHIFFSEGIVCCALNGFGHLLSHKEGVSIERLWDESDFLLKLLKREYVIRNRITTKDQMIDFIQYMIDKSSQLIIW